MGTCARGSGEVEVEVVREPTGRGWRPGLGGGHLHAGLGGDGRNRLAKAYANQLRYARFLHRDAVESLRRFHRPLVVSDDDELGFDRHLLNQTGKTDGVGLIERRVDFVEDAEGTRLVLEDGHQKGHRGERLFSAREQEHVL